MQEWFQQLHPVAQAALHGVLALFSAIDDVRLEFSDIMCDFIDGTQAEVGRAYGERLFKGFARMVGDDLSVCEGVIDRATHGAEVAPAFARINRCASRLPIGQRDVIFLHRAVHHAEVVVADLIAKTARATVDDDGDLVNLEP